MVIFHSYICFFQSRDDQYYVCIYRTYSARHNTSNFRLADRHEVERDEKKGGERKKEKLVRE